MDATFFIARTEEALGVCDIDDLPVDPAGESLPIPSAAVLKALSAIISPGEKAVLEPLRDATCRSFPVMTFASSALRRLAALAEGDADTYAQKWLTSTDWADADVDLYQLATLIEDLADSARHSQEADARLFVLLEEKAL